MNIVLDRVGGVDPMPCGLEICVHWIGLEIDVPFLVPQHVSFILVGCVLILTSIRAVSSSHIYQVLLRRFKLQVLQRDCSHSG